MSTQAAGTLAGLNQFHPLVQRWFESHYPAPTEIQAQAWPEIASGAHLLLTAPTGSGKTLTAFLWSLNRFLTGDLECGATRILYISPLKALNNDIRRNLLSPLAELRDLFAAEGETFPDIRVQTRSGDTDPETRRRMYRQPPEILITTPESLNLLLSSKSGLSLLQSLETVILDEIHGVVDSKRGTYLMSAVERLVPLSGEFQRIAISATVNPMDRVAAFVGGRVRRGTDFEPRTVSMLSSRADKRYEIAIRYPDAAAMRGEDEKIWDSLAEDFVERIRENRSTLLFVNSRALCEKLTAKINGVAGHTLAYAHHGSLSREIRSTVEERLKSGTLAAIVATSTLEMGIDIGALDEVILVQAPGSISATIQRIGRAGHGVGETSRCSIYPTHPQDFVESAVLGQAVLAGDIEAVDYIRSPLDVLAQVIISMAGMQRWDLDELFNEVRRSAAYAGLGRHQFDLVINMLAGRYDDSHIRELKPRVAVDRLENTIESRRGAIMSLYMSGGVIPDRGYYQLRHADTGARIGDLDEEFVWEATVGKVFSFGTQHWQVKKITHNEVLVTHGKPTGIDPPFWKSETISRSFHFAERIGEFMESADASLGDKDFSERLAADYQLDDNAAAALTDFLKRQREHCDAPLPHRHHLLIESVASGPQRASGSQVVLHTGWGAMVNRPFAMALESAWEARFEELPEIHITNECVVVQLAQPIDESELLSMVSVSQLEPLLRQSLEGSGFFGTRFRESAGRALLLSKGRFNERKPLWMSRLQSQKLMDATMKFEDFPILLETWRTCLRDEFDLDSLRLLLQEVESGVIAITQVRTQSPSPFAASVAWDQVNQYMYADDTPKARKQSRLAEGLLHEVAMTPGLRPALDPILIERFERERQRSADGYAPEDDIELLEWVKERSMIPIPEWQSLTGEDNIPETLSGKLSRLRDAVIATEDAKRLSALFTDPGADVTTFLSNFLQYYGPVTPARIAALTDLPDKVIDTSLTELLDDETLVSGVLVDGDDDITFCDATNYEYLLRLQRSRAQVSFEPRPLSLLPSFLHHWQTRDAASDPLDKLHDVLSAFRGYHAPAERWEADILPARIPGYDHRNLDLLFQEGAFSWVGAGDTAVTFIVQGDEDLLPAPGDIKTPLDDSPGRIAFQDLQDETGAGARELADSLWQSAWAGGVTNDTFVAVREGARHGFSIPEANDLVRTESRRLRRGAVGRMRKSMPLTGHWRRVNYPPPPADPIEVEELAKDRARLLLDRYGLIFRELLQRELPEFQWRAVFRSLRLMELAGEVLSGYFFEDIPGPQYIDPAAFRSLQRFTEDGAFWLNATDPLSLSGTGLGDWPRRVPGNYVVLAGERRIATVARGGKQVTFDAPPEEVTTTHLDVFHHLLYRSVDPMKKVVIETINEESSAASEYLKIFEQRFNVIRDYRSVYLQRSL